MAVPPFQDFFLPVLSLLKDGKEHPLSEIRPLLANSFKLSIEDLRDMVPSGRQSRFSNRVYWTRTHLMKAKLIESTGLGRIRITERGMALLAKGRNKLDLRDLSEYPEFRDFRGKGKAKRTRKVVEADEAATLTPEEILEGQYQSIRGDLTKQLLEAISKCSPQFFENLVLDLLVAMGYGGSRVDAEATGRSGDGGIDGIIRQDKLGVEVVYIQAKRWQNTVPASVFRDFIGALELKGASKGIFVTTSGFAKGAEEALRGLRQHIVLIDGQQLADYLIDYDIGVRMVADYKLKKIDADYFSEE